MSIFAVSIYCDFCANIKAYSHFHFISPAKTGPKLIESI
jgi:hypothetical protein